MRSWKHFRFQHIFPKTVEHTYSQKRWTKTTIYVAMENGIKPVRFSVFNVDIYIYMPNSRRCSTNMSWSCKHAKKRIRRGHEKNWSRSFCAIKSKTKNIYIYSLATISAQVSFISWWESLWRWSQHDSCTAADFKNSVPYMVRITMKPTCLPLFSLQAGAHD